MLITRRLFAASFFTFGGCAAAGTAGPAGEQMAGIANGGERTAPFILPPQPYAASALEPAIDTQTMTIHHRRHHQAYVNTMYQAIAADPALAQERLVARAETLPTIVRDNAGAKRRAFA